MGMEGGAAMSGFSFPDEQGRPVFVDGPDAIGEIKVDGRIWRFEYSDWLGPLWLKSDGYTERKCQCPISKKVWAAFDRWLERRNRNKGARR